MTDINPNQDPNINIDIDIDIIQLTNMVENLSTEKNKDEFIKNYSNVKEKIQLTDNMLESNMLGDLNKLSVNELFELLEKNQNKISNPSELMVSDLKMLLQVSKILEQRLTNDTINIIELK